MATEVPGSPAQSKVCCHEEAHARRRWFISRAPARQITGRTVMGRVLLASFQMRQVRPLVQEAGATPQRTTVFQRLAACTHQPRGRLSKASAVQASGRRGAFHLGSGASQLIQAKLKLDSTTRGPRNLRQDRGETGDTAMGPGRPLSFPLTTVDRPPRQDDCPRPGFGCQPKHAHVAKQGRPYA